MIESLKLLFQPIIEPLREITGSYYGAHVVLLLLVALVVPVIIGVIARVFVYRKDAEKPVKADKGFIPAEAEGVMAGTGSEVDPQPFHDWSPGHFPQVVALVPRRVNDSNTTSTGSRPQSGETTAEA
jgi:hypothetical protein